MPDHGGLSHRRHGDPGATGEAGVRVSELCGLRLTDVDPDRELTYVTGNGSRPRVVPFGAKTAQAVDRYLRVPALHQ